MKSLSLTKPHLIALIGVPGSGKTFFAEKFSETFHAPFINIDTIVSLSNSSVVASKKIADYQLGELLKTKQTALLEGLADTRAERAELAKKAQKAGYELLFVWVQTDSATAKQRATKPSGAKTNTIITPEQYDRAEKRFISPAPHETSLVISGKHTYATQAKVVLKRLSSPERKPSESPRKSPIIRAVSQPITREQRRNITIR